MATYVIRNIKNLPETVHQDRIYILIKSKESYSLEQVKKVVEIVSNENELKFIEANDRDEMLLNIGGILATEENIQVDPEIKIPKLFQDKVTVLKAVAKASGNEPAKPRTPRKRRSKKMLEEVPALPKTVAQTPSIVEHPEEASAMEEQKKQVPEAESDISLGKLLEDPNSEIKDVESDDSKTIEEPHDEEVNFADGDFMSLPEVPSDSDDSSEESITFGEDLDGFSTEDIEDLPFEEEKPEEPLACIPITAEKINYKGTTEQLKSIIAECVRKNPSDAMLQIALGHALPGYGAIVWAKIHGSIGEIRKALHALSS